MKKIPYVNTDYGHISIDDKKKLVQWVFETKPWNENNAADIVENLLQIGYRAGWNECSYSEPDYDPECW